MEIRLKQIHTNPVIADKRVKRSQVSNRSLAALETGNFQAVLDTLTPLQIRFCEEMLVHPKQNEAAIRAGYSEKTAPKIGYQLMENPAIRFVIDNMRAERSRGSEITKDYVLKEIVETISAAKDSNNHNATLRGLELLAKHLGMFIERTEISGPDGEAIKMEQKVKQDVSDFASRMARLASAGGTGNVLKFPDGTGEGTP